MAVIAPEKVSILLLITRSFADEYMKISLFETIGYFKTWFNLLLGLILNASKFSCDLALMLPVKGVTISLTLVGLEKDSGLTHEYVKLKVSDVHFGLSCYLKLKVSDVHLGISC